MDPRRWEDELKVTVYDRDGNVVPLEAMKLTEDQVRSWNIRVANQLASWDLWDGVEASLQLCYTELLKEGQLR